MATEACRRGVQPFAPLHTRKRLPAHATILATVTGAATVGGPYTPALHPPHYLLHAWQQHTCPEAVRLAAARVPGWGTGAAVQGRGLSHLPPPGHAAPAGLPCLPAAGLPLMARADEQPRPVLQVRLHRPQVGCAAHQGSASLPPAVALRQQDPPATSKLRLQAVSVHWGYRRRTQRSHRPEPWMSCAQALHRPQGHHAAQQRGKDGAQQSTHRQTTDA
jgi:hypothetical protein